MAGALTLPRKSFYICSGETADIITFGRSNKRSVDDHLIGMYGNGLKS